MKRRNKTEYKLYILIRTDLPSLTPGKAMAQAAHAANLLTAQWGLNQDVIDWKAECQNAFGTTITLAVDKDTLVRKLKKAQTLEHIPPFGAVYDPTYPFITTTEVAALIPRKKLSGPSIPMKDSQVMLFRKELTCGYILVADGSRAQAELVSDLSLHQ